MIAALTTSISGMRATQFMLDVTANNLANSETPGFKMSRVGFSDQLMTTHEDAIAPGAAIGGRNPDQVGNGVVVSTVQVQFQQGSSQVTNRDLDLSINGDGFFTLQDLDGVVSYSRVGAFGWDAGVGGGKRLVDLTTGNLVLNTLGQPIVSVETVAPTPTTVMRISGNLPPTATEPLHGRELEGLFTLRRADGSAAQAGDALSATNLARAAAPSATTLNLFGTRPDGQAFQSAVPLAAGATVQEVVDGLNATFISQEPVLDGNGNPVLDGAGVPLTTPMVFAKATLESGTVRVRAMTTGEELSVFLGEQALPAARDDATANTWQYGAATDQYAWNRMRLVPGSVNAEMPLYTADGTSHILQGRWFNAGTVSSVIGGTTQNSRVWDLVVDDPVGGSVTGGTDILRGVTFGPDGLPTATPALTMTSTWDTGGASSIAVEFTSITGFQDDGFIDAVDPDGAPSGTLQSVFIDDRGILNGIYSNNTSVAMSATDHRIRVAAFANPSGLVSISGNRWAPSQNSGDPAFLAPGDLATNLLSAGSLEGSNVDLSQEFTRLIISQRAFQSNSKAFQTADQLLQEANGLIR